MADKPTSSESLGLEIDSKSIKGAELSLRSGKPQLINVFEVKIKREEANPTNVKLLYTDEEKGSFTHLLEKNLVVTSLHTPEILARQLELGLTNGKDIDAVFEFQAEPLIPFPLEDGIVDKIPLKKTSEDTVLTIFAAKKESVQRHIEHCNSMRIEPEVVTCVPAALAGFSALFSPITTAHLILHLGVDCVTCALVEDGKLIATQSTDKGARDLKCTSKEGQIKALETLNFDISRVIHALTKQDNKHTPTGVILVGEGVEERDLVSSISKNISLEKLSIKKDNTFSIPEIKLQKYAVSIGSALCGLDKKFHQINFRQGDHSYPYPWKRTKKPLLTYFALSILLAASFFVLGNAYLAKKQDQIREDYVSLLAHMKKPYSEFEEKFRGVDLPEKEPSVFSLSKDDISNRITLLEKEIRSTPDLFPLLPNIPRVSDVLAWLSTHPHVTGSDNPDASSEPRIQLTSFNYKMVKRPEESKKRAKYQVKVDIEFTTPTPRYAREFHDILLSPNNIIDPKSDVKWGTERGKYRASFFLKDKTLYPQ